MSSLIRKLFSRHEDDEDYMEPMGGGPIVLSNPSFVEVTAVPENIIPYIWALVEKDAALTFLHPRDVQWLQWRIKRIALLPSLLQPEVPHPKIRELVNRIIRTWINEENTELLGFLRIKRSMLGFERRLSTITAYKHAY